MSAPQPDRSVPRQGTSQWDGGSADGAPKRSTPGRRPTLSPTCTEQRASPGRARNTAEDKLKVWLSSSRYTVRARPHGHDQLHLHAVTSHFYPFIQMYSVSPVTSADSFMMTSQ